MCYSKHVESCDEQLDIWRLEESKKGVAKVYTLFMIMFGVGVLGVSVGVFGHFLMSVVDSTFANVEFFFDAA
eukprot:SAG31_NODE_20627_length_569_cov_0.959574_1_plen_71_part_01